MPNYQNGKIYKIVNDELGLTYYGSTTQILSQRMGGHIREKKRFDKGKGPKVTSFQLLDGNQQIFLVEKYPCNDKIELAKRERYYIENNECVNKNIPSRTAKEYAKEYRLDNKDRLKQYQEEHYKDNKDKINQRHKQYYDNNKDKLKQKNRKYINNNKDKLKQTRKQYYDNNKDKKKQYYDNNKDKIKQYDKQYYDKNKDKYKQYYKLNKLKYLLSPKCIDDIFKNS